MSAPYPVSYSDRRGKVYGPAEAAKAMRGYRALRRLSPEQRANLDKLCADTSTSWWRSRNCYLIEALARDAYLVSVCGTDEDAEAAAAKYVAELRRAS